jgi:hypothetical protein
VITHNSLSDIQGGATGDEYYHLSEAQFSDLIGRSEVADVSSGLLSYTNAASASLQSKIDALPVADIFRTEVASVSGSLDDRVDVLEEIVQDTSEPTGFVNRTDSTISYDPVTRLFSITGSHEIYIAGVKHIKGDSTATIPADYGIHFIKYDSSGNLHVSQTPWNLATDVPISYVFVRNDLSDSFAAEERHGIVMDGVTHAYLHSTVGAKWSSGMVLGGWATGTNAVSAQKYSISAGTFYDEDIHNSVAALQDDGPYTILYRTGSSGNWYWEVNSSYPYLINSNSIQYNQ